MARFDTSRGPMLKKDAKAAVSAILYRSFGPLKDPEEIAFVLSVLEHHVNWDRKSAGGVKLITRRKNPPYDSPGFWLIKEDGSPDTNISYREAITPSTNLSELTQACRLAIESWMMEEKYRHSGELPVTDPVTGIKTYWMSECELDHQVPFVEIRDGWVEKLGYVPELVSDDSTIGSRFADPKLTVDWYDYHAEHAVMRLVSKEEHRRITDAQTAERARARRGRK